MKKNLSAKKAFCLISALFVFALQNAFALEENFSVTDLTYQSPSWVAETGASAVCQPERTSWGYIFITEGKMLNGINQNGTILWQEQYTQKISPFLTAIPGDLFYAVFSSSQLTLINSSLNFVWQKDVGFEITEKPLCAFDGRVIVRGSSKIACYSVKGDMRWCIDIQNQDTEIPLAQFEDGSLLVVKKSNASTIRQKSESSNSFAKKMEFQGQSNNQESETSQIPQKQTAIRLSPFGETLEEINFSSQLKELCPTKCGILTGFADGKCALLSVKDKSVAESWAITGEALSSSTSSKFYALDNGTEALLFTSSNEYPCQIRKIKLSNAEIKTTALYQSLSPSSQIMHVEQTSGGTVVCFSDNAICISSSLKILWQAKYNKKKKCRFAFSTDYGYLVLCTDDWVVEAFRMQQSFNKSKYTYSPVELKPYLKKFPQDADNWPLSTSYFNEQHDKVQSEYEKVIGAKEEDYYFDLDSQFEDISISFDSAHEYSQAQLMLHQDIAEITAVMSLLAESGTFTRHRELAYLMQQVEDPTVKLVLVKAAGSIAYDPDGQLLKALDKLSIKWKNKKDVVFYRAMCDSVYSICAFMGRPSFFETGEKILSYLISTVFESGINSYARETLKKVISLKL